MTPQASRQQMGMKGAMSRRDSLEEVIRVWLSRLPRRRQPLAQQRATATPAYGLAIATLKHRR